LSSARSRSPPRSREVAYATIPDANGVIHGCYNKPAGLRIIDPSAGESCTKNETALEWSQRGPAGETGPEGPPGPQGEAAPDPDAVDATVAITGQIQGVFSSTPIGVSAVSHEIVSPRDPSSGLPTGKRQHKPFVITKEVDKSTPLILNALVHNENLTSVVVTLESPKGTPAMTITLTNASVAARTQTGMREHLSFVYQKITWTWIDGGVTAMDDWEAPIA
jgi:type VI secretion system secreted protein Hcp